MRILITTAALIAATTVSAHASCGGEWSFSANIDEFDGNKTSLYDPNRGAYSSNNNSVYDDRNEYGVGIRFTMPLGDDDCEYTRARAQKERDLGRKARADAEKAQAEADYAANRAMKEEEFAISKRIDNLQRLVVTCETHDLAICKQIDELSLELFN